MRVRRVFLIRHGAIGKDCERRYIGWIDPPLSDAGRCQAARLGSLLAEVELEGVYSSDLIRARDTALIICANKGIEPVLCKDLREISLGAWEGKSFAEIRAAFPDEFYKRGDDIVHYEPPSGESFAQCSARALFALHDILRHSTGDILIVGHAGINRAIICHFLGLPLENLFNIRQDYGCLNELGVSTGGIYIQTLNYLPQKKETRN